MTNPNLGGADDEFINADEIEFVKRGRQSSADPEVVGKLARLPKGKAYPIKSLALDPTNPDYRNEKNRVSGQIRSACKLAGLTKYSIRWSPAGVPQVVNRGK